MEKEIKIEKLQEGYKLWIEGVGKMGLTTLKEVKEKIIKFIEENFEEKL